MNKIQEYEVKHPRRLVFWVIVAQLLITLGIAIVLALLEGFKAGYSVLVAGIICALPNGYFGWRVFSHQGARAAKRFMVAFCFGEMVKLCFLGIFFIVAVLFLRVTFGPFLVGFIISLMVYWIAPFVMFGFLEKQ